MVGAGRNCPRAASGRDSFRYSSVHDILYEHYLKPLGLLSAGFFYKDIRSRSMWSRRRSRQGLTPGIRNPGR